MKDIRANENRVLGIRGKGVRASPRMAKVTYTLALSDEQVTILKACLLRDGFEFKEKEHVLYSAKKGKLNVTVYRKGPKVLVQGKETEALESMRAARGIILGRLLWLGFIRILRSQGPL
jgi:hypothetical protein